MPCSNMSSVDSITYTGSIADLQDLDMDQIKMFEHYKFKDSSHSSNNLFISQMREKVIYIIVCSLLFLLHTFVSDIFIFVLN